MTTVKALCDRVRQVAYDIHVYHGHGHLEKVYENALAHRLRKAGLRVKQRHPINVLDEDGTLLGDYFADLLVEGALIVELKTVRALAPEHEAQILGYLKSSRMEHGLLINFGAYKFEIRKFAWNENSSVQRTKPKKWLNREERRNHKEMAKVMAGQSDSLCSLRSLRLNNALAS
jgi:GxxExxY protein